MVQKDELDSKGYNVFMELVENTNLYELSSDQIRKALSYIETSEATTTAGIELDVLDNVKMEEEFELERI